MMGMVIKNINKAFGDAIDSRFESRQLAAAYFDVSDSFISAIVCDHKQPTKKMLDWMGVDKKVDRKVSYTKK